MCVSPTPQHSFLFLFSNSHFANSCHIHVIIVESSYSPLVGQTPPLWGARGRHLSFRPFSTRGDSLPLPKSSSRLLLLLFSASLFVSSKLPFFFFLSFFFTLPLLSSHQPVECCLALTVLLSHSLSFLIQISVLNEPTPREVLIFHNSCIDVVRVCNVCVCMWAIRVLFAFPLFCISLALSFCVCVWWWRNAATKCSGKWIQA